VRHEHFFQPKTVKIANFTTASLPVTCYECSWGGRLIREAKLFSRKSSQENRISIDINTHPREAQHPVSVCLNPFSFRSRLLYVFSLKNTLQLRQLQELTPEEYAEGVVDIRSPGWSEAEPWVLNVNRRPAQSGRG